MNSSDTMTAIVADGSGGIQVTTRPIPIPNVDEYLIKIAAFGINRADVMQVDGKYPPPPGTTDILGLEAAGHLESGELVGALLKGGGYAEYAVVPKNAVLKFSQEVTHRFSIAQLAGLPEAFLAAYHVMFQVGKLAENESVLINAAGSGVGTSAIQLAATVPTVRIIACAGSDDKLAVCKQLGAHHVINYKHERISDAVKAATNGMGVNLVLDCVAAAQFKENERSLAQEGRWVIYGALSGVKSPDIGLGGILFKRLSITGTTMRSRTTEFRGEMVANFMHRFGRFFSEPGSLHPIVHKEFAGLEACGEALEYMRSNENIGKLIVHV